MKCPTVEHLAAYHAELLSAREQEQLRQHLTGCERCRQEIAALNRTVQLLESAPSPTVPDNLWTGVANRLPANSRRAWWGQWWWKAAASCGLAASLLLGLAISHQSTPMPAASPGTASYVTTHELLSAQDPLSDRASLGAMLIAQRNSQ